MDDEGEGQRAATLVGKAQVKRGRCKMESGEQSTGKRGGIGKHAKDNCMNPYRVKFLLNRNKAQAQAQLVRAIRDVY